MCSSDLVSTLFHFLLFISNHFISNNDSLPLPSPPPPHTPSFFFIRYYNSVQSQPKLSQYEMGEYLRETAQVCANSVEQVEPDIASDSQNLGPASMVIHY